MVQEQTHSRKNDLREDVIFMYRMGEYPERIAARSGCTVGTVKTMINTYERERARGKDAEEQQVG